MPTVQKREQQPSDKEQEGRDKLHLLIGEQVMHTLGKPQSLQNVQVRRLWGAYYRVNVLVGPDIVSTRITNSYFVKADSDGNILEATPKITKQY